MSDPLEDLISGIVENNPKPQSEKAEVFSSTDEETDQEEEESEDMVFKQVPKRKRNPTCGTCRKKLKGGEWHWYYIDLDDGEVFWWCYQCMKSVDVLPTEEEMKRAGLK